MKRVALKGLARAPRAHGPDHAGHRARRRHGERRVHADRHHARRGRRACRRRLRRHRRRRHRPHRLQRRVDRLDGQAPDDRRRACSSASARSRRSRVAVGDITDEAKIVARDGKPAGDGPYFGVGYDSAGQGRRRPPRRSAWTPAAGPPAPARSSSTPRPPRRSTTPSARACASTTRGEARTTYEVVGIARFGDGQVARHRDRSRCSTCATAQTLFGKDGALRLDPGRRPRRRARRRRPQGRRRRRRLRPPRCRPPGAGPLHARGPEEVHLDHPDRAARVRLRGDLRRRVHDLQHALDHRRPALARVRAAADGRRRRAGRSSARCCSRRWPSACSPR